LVFLVILKEINAGGDGQPHTIAFRQIPSAIHEVEVRHPPLCLDGPSPELRIQRSTCDLDCKPDHQKHRYTETFDYDVIEYCCCAPKEVCL